MTLPEDITDDMRHETAIDEQENMRHEMSADMPDGGLAQRRSQ